jgi:hypothetical protein
MIALDFSKASFQIITRLENFCSPRDFALASEDIIAGGDGDLTAALIASEAYQALQHCTALSPLAVEFETQGARLYSRPDRRGKRLVVGFTGRAFRFMMPLSIFQQAIPDDTDVLVLFDVLNDHYRRGIFDGKTSLFDLPKRLAEITARYCEVISFGTSGGALPALRFSKLARISRGISIGGRVIDDTIRILKGSPLPPAYDPLCACHKSTAGQALLVFGDQHAADSRSARIVAACIDAELIPVKGCAEHNLLWPVYKAGRLNAFLELLLDPRSTLQDLVQFPLSDGQSIKAHPSPGRTP